MYHLIARKTIVSIKNRFVVPGVHIVSLCIDHPSGKMPPEKLIVTTMLMLGFGLFVLAGICNGLLAFPQKFVKTFPWENTWGSFWFMTMVLIPAAVIPFLVHDLWGIWSQAGCSTVLMTLFFGLLWGVGCITFGIAIHLAGLSLGFTLIVGIMLAVGSLLPLIVLHPETLSTTAGVVIIAGIVCSVWGVLLVGYAGFLKDKALKAQPASENGPDTKTGKIAWAVFASIVSGVTSACLNLGYAFSGRISEIAAAPPFDNPPWAAGLASWQLLFWGGFLSAGGFAAVLITRNRHWKAFRRPGAGHDLSLTMTMALLHFITVSIYGVGAYFVGALGTSLGFAAFLSLSIVIANTLGFATAEWRGVGPKPVRWMLTGIVVLVLSVSVLGIGNLLQQRDAPPEPLALKAHTPHGTAILLSR